MVTRSESDARFLPVVRLGDGLLVGASLGVTPPPGRRVAEPLDRAVAEGLRAVAPLRATVPCFSLRVPLPGGVPPAAAHLLLDGLRSAGTPVGMLRVVVPLEHLRPGGSAAVDQLRGAGVALDVLVSGAVPSELTEVAAMAQGLVLGPPLVATVDGAPGDLRATVVLVGLARRQGLDVHAEGVSSAHEAWVLASLGCLTGQGSLAGGLVTAEQLRARIVAEAGSALATAR